MEQPAPTIGVQTIGTPEPQPIVPAQVVTQSSTATDNNTVKPKKKKKGLMIFLLLILCFCVITIIGLVVAYLNIGAIAKSLATVKTDDTYSRVTGSEMASFDLEEYIKTQEITVDEDNKATIEMPTDKVLDIFGNVNDTSIGESLGIKLNANDAKFQIEYTKLLSLINQKPTIGTESNFAGLLVAGNLELSGDKKSFLITNLTTGNSIVDYLLPKDASTLLATKVNASLEGLTDNVEEITIANDKLMFVYNVTPVDLDQATSLDGQTVPTVFDYDQLEYKVIDANTVDVYYTEEQWLEMMYITVYKNAAETDEVYVDINDDDQFVVYISMNAIKPQSVKVEFDDPSRYFIKIVYEANNTQGLHVVSVGFDNPLIDSYFTEGLLDEIKQSLDMPINSTVVGTKITDNEVILRIRV